LREISRGKEIRRPQVLGGDDQVRTDERRDPTVLCVVEEPRDIVAVERTQEFRGRYHVLQGTISPIEGIGPDQLRIKDLLQRKR